VTRPGARAALNESLRRLSEELDGIESIAFDLDGTLYDTRDFERPALNAVAQWLRMKSGKPLRNLATELCNRRERNRHRAGLFDELLLEHQLPLDWGAECLRRFHGHSARELADAASLKDYLLSLRAAGRRLAMVSNGPEALQTRKIDCLGLVGIFDVCIYCVPEFPERQKPSPWAWSQLTGWRGAGPATYVGDDPVDEQFARAGNAGFVPFRFRSPTYAD
jgi:FMN phosphatase YigB (HAD superfamily)